MLICEISKLLPFPFSFQDALNSLIDPFISFIMSTPNNLGFAIASNMPRWPKPSMDF